MGTQNQDLQKMQISSLEQFRPPPHKSGSKPNFSSYLFIRIDISKNGQNRPKMALFTSNSTVLKFGKLLEQKGSRQFAVFSSSVGKILSTAHGRFAALKRISRAADYKLTHHLLTLKYDFNSSFLFKILTFLSYERPTIRQNSHRG